MCWLFFRPRVSAIMQPITIPLPVKSSQMINRTQAHRSNYRLVTRTIVYTQHDKEKIIERHKNKKEKRYGASPSQSSISQPCYRTPFTTVEIETDTPASTEILFPTVPSTLVSACNIPPNVVRPDGACSYEAKYNS